jgi:hypothetical protein
LKRRDHFIEAFDLCSIEYVDALYTECMEEGTKQRKEKGTLIQGENIDQINLDI